MDIHVRALSFIAYVPVLSRPLHEYGFLSLLLFQPLANLSLRDKNKCSKPSHLITCRISNDNVTMDANVHMAPATVHYPVDKGSSLLTHPERHLRSTRFQPRSAGAGFICKWELGEILDARRLNKQICEEIIKGPPNASQDEKPRPERRKHSIKTVFGSRSKRKVLKEKEMPVATHRTSDGRKYGQILSGQIYDESGNASTYQVNESRLPVAPCASEGQRKHPRASLDLIGDVIPNTHQVTESEELVNGCSNHSGFEMEEAKHRLLPYQTVGIPSSPLGSLGNRNLIDRKVDGNITFGRNVASLESSRRKSATDDSLGLLRDFSQILSRGETTSLAAGASGLPPPEAEHQPRIRDFARDGSAPFSRARAAIPRRSLSPIKKTGKQSDSLLTPDKSLDAATYVGQSRFQLGRSPDSIISAPVAFARPSPLPIGQEQAPGTRTSPVIHYHSKAPSVASAESTAEDIQSDASSGVVSNAQSAVFVKVPPLPGPAPLTPLPSLPEGLDVFSPATPRATQSSRRVASPESSPSKVPPQRSPARSQYKLYPTVKIPGSPVRTAATEPEQGMTRPSLPLRSKRRGFSFPRSDYLPTSVSVGALDELEQWEEERADVTRQKKVRDLARMMSHKATIAEVEPAARNAGDGERYHKAATELPSPLDSYDSAFFPLAYRPQASQISNLSASTTFQYRESSTHSQKLSPIIVIAEQAPTLPVQRVPSQKSQFHSNNTDEYTRGPKTKGFCPVLASPSLQRPKDESKARPLSSHSLPVPRPIASRVPTSHLSHLVRAPSYCSRNHSSIHERSSLEARLSVVERKNAMLERAFLAVLDTSAAFGGSQGRNGREGTSRDTSSGVSDRDGDHSCGTSGTESLYVGLEDFMALHSGSAGARWSTSSGP